MTRLLALAALLMLAPAAGAHEWYDAYCCSGRDCYPTRGRVAPGGYVLADSAGREWFFADGDGRIRPSRDGRFHLCRAPGDQAPRCVYVPTVGM